ncbi:MAG: ABC transporter substrate-binding protein, partial [Archangium sp.]
MSDVSDFALKDGHFKADLRVWVKWRGEPVVPEITFENLAELDSKDEMGFEHDGAWHSAQWRVQGTFRGDFPVHSFPFDTQTLPVVIGLEDTGGVLIPDLGASGMSPAFSITGWSYEPFFQARTDIKQFGSDLGSIPHEGKSAKLRRATFMVEMHRPFGPYVLKFALPLSLILLMALLALFLPGDRIDVRSSMGITALLACIAFHYTQADTLPDVTYLVAADKLFLGAYVFITATFLCSVASFRLSLRNEGAAKKLDRIGTVALPLVALFNAGMLVASAIESTYREPPPLPEVAPSQPLLRVASPNVDSVNVVGGPSRRTQLVVRGSDGIMRAAIVEEAPAMTNSMVRLLPDGGMTVRWRLRQGAKWSDGRRITTEDLEYSVKVSNDPLRTKIVAVDDRTLDITYSERHGEYLNGFPVFPKNTKPIGDGGADALSRFVNSKELASAAPYLTGELTAGQKLTLVRNESYVGPRPAFERIELIQKTPEEAAAALLAKELDVIASL